MKNKKGFTLVEILIVIAIIAMITAAIYVNMGVYRQRSINSSFTSTARSSVSSFVTKCNADPTNPIAITAAGIGLNATDFTVTGNCNSLTVKPAAGGKYANSTTNCVANGVVIKVYSGLSAAPGSDCL